MQSQTKSKIDYNEESEKLFQEIMKKIDSNKLNNNEVENDNKR